MRTTSTTRAATTGRSRRPRRRTAALVAVASLGSLAGLLPVGAAPAGALAPTWVPRTISPSSSTFTADVIRDVVVDPGSGRLFISADDGVVVRAPSGAAVGTITGLPSAGQLAAGGGSIFVMLAGTSTIKRINPSTLAITGTWTVPTLEDQEGAFALAYAGGLLWTVTQSTWVDPEWEEEYVRPDLVSINPTTGARTSNIYVPGGIFGEESSLVTSPDGSRLAIVEGSSSSTVYLWDRSGATATYVAKAHTDVNGASAAFSADGTRIELAGGSPYEGVELAVPSLLESGVTYPAAAYPSASATSPAAGGLVAVGADSTPSKVWIYRQGNPIDPVTFSATTAQAHRSIVRDGLAFAPDGSKAYAVLEKDFVDDDGKGTLLVANLGPTVSSPSPAVAGTRGGARITITGSGLAGATATVKGLATTAASGDASTLAFTVPALPTGWAAVQVTASSGFSSPTPSPLVVVDLGPFRDGPAFVDKQHRDTLGRAATAAERSTEVGKLAGGTAPGALMAKLVRDPAFAARRASLIRLYQAVFLRAPDTSGFTYWLGKMQAGTSLVRMAATFAASNEFKTRYGPKTNAQFVDLVYQNVLGRPADPGGRAYWIKKLDTGTSRGVLITGFSESGEYTRKMTAQVEVTDLYLATLRRMPSTDERTAGIAALGGGTSLATLADGILRSPAYLARIG
jgi:hypothetical protein